ncbi:MAG: hypothetical protein ACI8RP_001259 [Urechidicola sp.]|jgi:hypothetical protein
MQINNFLYIIGAVIIAMLIAVFHYMYKSKNNKKVNILLTFLRFISLFSLFLLLLNLKFEQEIINTVKPNLIVAVDNSKSIKHLGGIDEVNSSLETLRTHKKLNNKFAIDYYSFGTDVTILDSISFNQNQTNISKPFKQFEELYRNEIAPVIIISDGNQTFGPDYEYYNYKQPIFPIVIGDTIQFDDLKISQQNVNRYTYLKNKFPVEVFLNYDGVKSVNPTFSVFKGTQKVYSKKLNFSSYNTSQNLSFYLTANSVGTHYYTTKISYLDTEKNTINNDNSFVVEVIDEQTKVLIVTSFLHPDAGMLKESIESNKQRKVTIKSTQDEFQIKDYQLVILYQPTSEFQNIFSELKTNNRNHFIITGSKTDWEFLNTIQNNFSKNWIENTENYAPIFNSDFSTFATDDFGFDNLSPLVDKFGTIEFNVPFESLLFQKTDGYTTKNPLLATYEIDNSRVAVLFGENSWRWRMTSKLENNSFENFDNLINKMVQYLSSNIRSSRLLIDYKPVYYAGNNIKVNAKYLNKNYQFDSTAKLWISVKNRLTNKHQKSPLSKINNNYLATLDGLSSGDYDFTISVDNETEKVNGRFKILEFAVEQQFVNANHRKLNAISKRSLGKTYFNTTIPVLINDLINDDRFKPIQRTENKQNSLIDWEWLLGLIIVSLSIEWVIRKYNGLI